MALKVITAPAAEPLTLAEAKAHLRVDGIDEDGYITALIVAARQGAESITGRALMAQTLELAMDAFPGQIVIPRPPLASVTSITYVDESGVTQTLAPSAYAVNSHAQPAMVDPAYGTTWPATRSQANAVLVRYVAGYAAAADVPQEIKQWMLLRIGMLFENRESVAAGVQFSALPFVDSLLAPYRVWEL